MSLVIGRLKDPKDVNNKSAKELNLGDLVKFKNVENSNDFIKEIQNSFSQDFYQEYNFDRIIDNDNKIYYVYKRPEKTINNLDLNRKSADFWYDIKNGVFISTNKKFIKALPALIKNTIIESRQAA